MKITPALIQDRILRELDQLSDSRVLNQIHTLIVEPYMVMRDWDYSDKGQQYPCWTVLEHQETNSGLMFCQNGFGPQHPWGLMLINGEHQSMGMDSNWYNSFMGAYFESRVPTVLPIWIVHEQSGGGESEPISNELSWDAAWEQVEVLRKKNPLYKYDCWAWQQRSKR
ncbi:MAG: hypothetical protein AAF498_05050 [Pseudomonadota bacterium]